MLSYIENQIYNRILSEKLEESYMFNRTFTFQYLQGKKFNKVYKNENAKSFS